MGATTFETRATGATAAAAFGSAVDSAAYEYGHGGYTGTIAEKSGFVEFQVPEGHSVRETIDALGGEWDDASERMVYPSWIPRRMAETYDDKWGPAVAFQVARVSSQGGKQGTYVFCGWASC